ncbi:hypothetical protein GIB67_011504 [Kingdonia uniflora]|uniref:Beta-galactosidase beta-sandwich domain-containing protein n=1 Tax=Kingdonia uniflora TaxID=39325 RepID=A0A7J7NLP8_9MAGN|nr:hypothetical protein GIB67_011504 [Kingdonia uniflora]
MLELAEEVKKNVEEVLVTRDNLGQKLIDVGYSVSDIEAIIEGHFVEEADAKDEPDIDGSSPPGVVKGLDAIFARIDLEIQEGESKKDLTVGLGAGVPWVMCKQDDVPDLIAHVYKYQLGGCAAFLVNYNSDSFARVAFGVMHYSLPPWSISILPDYKNTVFNTARVSSQSSQKKMVPVQDVFSWQSYNEEAATYNDNLNTLIGLLEQINTTRDVTDYLWYSVS